MTLETVGISRRQSSVTNCNISGSGNVMGNRSRKPRRGKMCCRRMSIFLCRLSVCPPEGFRMSHWSDSTMIDRHIVCLLWEASAQRVSVFKTVKTICRNREGRWGGREGNGGKKTHETAQDILVLVLRFPAQCRRWCENILSDAKCEQNELPCCRQSPRYTQRKTERAVNHSLSHTHWSAAPILSVNARGPKLALNPHSVATEGASSLHWLHWLTVELKAVLTWLHSPFRPRARDYKQTQQ